MTLKQKQSSLNVAGQNLSNSNINFSNKKFGSDIIIPTMIFLPILAKNHYGASEFLPATLRARLIC